MKKKTTTKGASAVELAVIGASLAGLAATAYFFLGPKGKKHQRETKAWAIKMKGDIVEKLEKARDISEPVYHEIINSVAARYGKEMKANHKEIAALAQDLKKHWKTISVRAKAIKRDTVKGANKAVKKAKR
ncbi:MAG: hypothetical protein WC835_01425 [Candidatus Paceibacterota bacterium]|jgi:hypothetical protein